MTFGKLLRGTAAVLMAVIISTVAYLVCGVGLPNWIYGSEWIAHSPDGAQILFAFVSLASIYSIFSFILLTVFLYRKFTALPKHV